VTVPRGRDAVAGLLDPVLRGSPLSPRAAARSVCSLTSTSSNRHPGVSNLGQRPGNVTAAHPHNPKPKAPRQLLSPFHLIVMIPVRR
jgi:hypothetical protein